MISPWDCMAVLAPQLADLIARLIASLLALPPALINREHFRVRGGRWVVPSVTVVSLWVQHTSLSVCAALHSRRAMFFFPLTDEENFEAEAVTSYSDRNILLSP